MVSPAPSPAAQANRHSTAASRSASIGPGPSAGPAATTGQGDRRHGEVDRQRGGLDPTVGLQPVLHEEQHQGRRNRAGRSIDDEHGPTSRRSRRCARRWRSRRHRTSACGRSRCPRPGPEGQHQRRHHQGDGAWSPEQRGAIDASTTPTTPSPSRQATMRLRWTASPPSSPPGLVRHAQSAVAQVGHGQHQHQPDQRVRANRLGGMNRPAIPRPRAHARGPPARRRAARATRQQPVTGRCRSTGPRRHRTGGPPARRHPGSPAACRTARIVVGQQHVERQRDEGQRQPQQAVAQALTRRQGRWRTVAARPFMPSCAPATRRATPAPEVWGESQMPKKWRLNAGSSTRPQGCPLAVKSRPGPGRCRPASRSPARDVRGSRAQLLLPFGQRSGAGVGLTGHLLDRTARDVVRLNARR